MHWGAEHVSARSEIPTGSEPNWSELARSFRKALALSIQKTVSATRSLFGTLLSTRHNVKLSGEIPLAALLERFALPLAALKPPALVSDWRGINESINLRGRPPESFAGSDTPLNAAHKLAANEEELIEIEAVLGKGRDPMRFVLKTRFSRFERGAIVYEVCPIQFGLPPEVAKFLTLRRTARLLPVRIEAVRIGLEFFRKRLFAGTLGLTPTISGRFYLASSRELLTLTVENLAPGDKNTPLDSIVFALHDALHSLELYRDLQGELQLG